MTTVLEPIRIDAPTRPVEVLPSRAMQGKVNIVSIYPKALRHQLTHNGITTYKIPAAPRGSYSMLTVYDTQAWINRPSESNGKVALMPMPIPAMVVAINLRDVWARFVLGAKSGFYPGIDIIEGDDPTAEELGKLRETQNALFDWFIRDAHGKHIKGEHTEITDDHRMAALEMLDKAAERFPWFPKTRFSAVKDCIVCGFQIDVKAKACSECKTNLVDWYIKYNLDSTLDPAIHEFIQMIGKAGKRGEKTA